MHARTAFCKSVLQHAVSSIDIILANDQTLVEIETGLRYVDLDTSVVAKHNGAQQISEHYVALRASAVAGRAEVKALKAEASAATTDDQKKALLTFANALDGALIRQRALADALGRLVVYVDNHPPIDKDEHDRLEFEAIKAQHLYAPRGPLSTVPDSLSTVAKQGADELEQRSEPIAGDEYDAASRIDRAFEACPP